MKVADRDGRSRSGITLLGLRKPMMLDVPPTALVDLGTATPAGAAASAGSLVGKPAIVLTAAGDDDARRRSRRATAPSRPARGRARDASRQAR